METQTLKDRIKVIFPDAEFGRHETDLYIKVVPGLIDWMKTNYEYFRNCEVFVSQLDGEKWLDVPFAAWNEKYKNNL